MREPSRPSRTDIALASQAASATPSTLAQIDQERQRIEARMVRVSDGSMKFRPGALPTTQEREAFDRWIATTRNCLQRRLGNRTLQAGLEALASSGLATPNGADVDMLVAVYQGVLSRSSEEAFKAAVDVLLNGMTDPHGPTFSQTYMPSAPQLATLCRTIEDRMILRLDNASMLMSRPEARPVAPELPEAVRRANLRKIAALRIGSGPQADGLLSEGRP